MVSVVYLVCTPACEAGSMGSTPVGHPRIGSVTSLECVMSERVLQRPTLILNRNWQPVNVATVARALVLLWNEAARVVDACQRHPRAHHENDHDIDPPLLDDCLARPGQRDQQRQTDEAEDRGATPHERWRGRSVRHDPDFVCAVPDTMARHVLTFH